ITSSRLFFTLLRPPTSTLFPYTTLFRSRNSYAGQWQNRRSVWTWTAAFLALASMVGICVYRYAEVWTPLERFYVTTYIRSVLRSLVKFSRTDSYWTVSAVGKKGSHWALDEEVIEVKTGTGETALALTPEDRKSVV